MDRTPRNQAQHNQPIYDQAAEWFVNFREGDVDRAAKKAFHQWLRESPSHIEAYLEVSALWADVPQAVNPDDVDVAALIAEARGAANVVDLPLTPTLSPQAGRGSEGGHEFFSLSLWERAGVRAIAASLAFAFLTTAALGWWQLRAPTYATGIGEQRLITLTDGSSVELNTRSKVRVHYTDERRDVELLAGQALFRVEKDPNRSFVVKSGATQVRAVGTQFDVYRKSGETVVTVLEGRVEVLPERISTPVILSTQEQITVAATRLLPSEPASEPQPANLAVATAWTQRQMVFEGTPLAQVVEEVNRYNPRPLVITDPALETVRISGVFSVTRPAVLVLFLRDEVGLAVIDTGKEIQITRQSNR